MRSLLILALVALTAGCAQGAEVAWYGLPLRDLQLLCAGALVGVLFGVLAFARILLTTENPDA
jgi:hypothetical protein